MQLMETTFLKIYFITLDSGTYFTTFSFAHGSRLAASYQAPHSEGSLAGATIKKLPVMAPTSIKSLLDNIAAISERNPTIE